MIDRSELTTYLVLMDLRENDVWYGYDELAKSINRTIPECKESMKTLRQLGYVVHNPTIDQDGRPNGSGFFITPKGRYAAVIS